MQETEHKVQGKNKASRWTCGKCGCFNDGKGKCWRCRPGPKPRPLPGSGAKPGEGQGKLI